MLNFQILITYLNDLIKKQVSYQYLNINSCNMSYINYYLLISGCQEFFKISKSIWHSCHDELL
jgi:hypothetical protein